MPLVCARIACANGYADSHFNGDGCTCDKHGYTDRGCLACGSIIPNPNGHTVTGADGRIHRYGTWPGAKPGPACGININSGAPANDSATTKDSNNSAAINDDSCSGDSDPDYPW